MAIVSFWNDGKNETGKSTTIAAIATSMSINTTYKMLIFDTTFNDTTILDCFTPQVKNSKYSFVKKGITDLDTGIPGVAKAILSNKTSPEIISNYTKTIFKGRLEILSESSNLEDAYMKQRRTYAEIVKMANRFYDIVFVDLSKVKDDNIEREIIDMSTIIVASLNQNVKSFNRYLSQRKNGIFINKKNMIILLGRSDLYSKYNAKNLSRVIGEKDVFSVPYTTAFYEAANEGNVAEYFMKFRVKSNPDKNTELMNGVNMIAERIISKIKEMQMGI